MKAVCDWLNCIAAVIGKIYYLFIAYVWYNIFRNGVGNKVGDKMLSIGEVIAEIRSYCTEREWFELKEKFQTAHEAGEYISALANSAALCGRDFAYLVWGIADKTNEVKGTNFDFDADVKGEPLKHFLARQLFPDVDFVFEETVVEGKRLVVLIIPAARYAPVAFANERYIRIGSSKEKLRKFPEMEARLFEVIQHGAPTLENSVAEEQELSFTQLFVYYASKGLELKEATFRKNLCLLTCDGHYNLLAQLLSDNSHFPVRVAIFSGTSKSANMYSVREFGYQCLLYSLDEVLRYADVLNIIQADEGHRIVERAETPLFSNEAFREAIVNAFVHNKWVSGNEPMITVFSDRIEIMSRGTLAPTQTLEGFFSGESVPVNKKLCEIFLQLHISEKTGRGVPKITSMYGEEAFEFREDSIVVKIPFKWINVMGHRALYSGLNATQQRILAEIRNNPNITKKELFTLIGVSKSTVDNGISILKKRGIITRIGSNKTGYWQIEQ